MIYIKDSRYYSVATQRATYLTCVGRSKALSHPLPGTFSLRIVVTAGTLALYEDLFDGRVQLWKGMLVCQRETDEKVVNGSGGFGDVEPDYEPIHDDLVGGQVKVRGTSKERDTS